jgi:hypothetical protein
MPFECVRNRKNAGCSREILVIPESVPRPTVLWGTYGRTSARRVSRLRVDSGLDRTDVPVPVGSAHCSSTASIISSIRTDLELLEEVIVIVIITRSY